MLYVMYARPADTPVISPVDASTLATAGALLLHVPPLTPCVNVVVNVLHTLNAPLMAAGTFTVTSAVVKQVALVR